MVNPDNVNGTQAVYRYAVGNNFKSISVFKDKANGTATKTGVMALTGLALMDRNIKTFVPVQLAVNAVNGQLLLGYYGLYTSADNGNTVSLVLPVSNQPVTALAYGGKNPGGTDAANVIYAARGKVIWVRGPGGANVLFYSASVSSSTPISSIVLDPNNWQVAYAVGSSSVGGAGAVYATVNGGHSWKNITGNLAPFNSGLDAVQIVALYNGNGMPIHDELLVGGADGVFFTQDPLGAPNAPTYPLNPSTAPAVIWTAWNVGLPHAPVTDISYTPSLMLKVNGVANTTVGNVLVVSTLGRGVYSMADASTLLERGAGAHRPDCITRPIPSLSTATGTITTRVS